MLVDGVGLGSDMKESAGVRTETGTNQSLDTSRSSVEKPPRSRRMWSKWVELGLISADCPLIVAVLLSMALRVWLQPDYRWNKSLDRIAVETD
jgi:hypothetical protein